MLRFRPFAPSLTRALARVQSFLVADTHFPFSFLFVRAAPKALALDESAADSEWQERRDDDCRPPPHAWQPAQPFVEAFLQSLPVDVKKEKGKRKV